jgi:hypothetical protein
MKESQAEALSLTRPGRFVVGCNYWASHAGTRMWSDWRPAAVEADFRRLSRAGLQVLRVFPLWPDFQPLKALYSGGGAPYELRLGEEPLPDDELGRAGVSAQAVARFAKLADLAGKHGLRLVVGLVTGWMSGRLFVPPAFEGRNVLTDPAAIMWQVRFVRAFVRRMRAHPAILAWDLGNECNCMAAVPGPEAAWLWTSSIAGAIRAEDLGHPVVSGMHSLGADPKSAWTIAAQAELTDVLTTHPYPYFTPHCDRDPLDTIRTILHSTAESRLYADVGGRPCLVEEIGSLGPMLGNEETAARFLRAALFSAWAHDCHGLLWWCAFDQAHLGHPPYDWDNCERELGLLRADGRAKPALAELAGFRKFLDRLPFRELPPRRTDAVCILTRGQDNWGAALGSFVLAKQAGLDIEFQHSSQPLRDSGLYLMPSVSGARHCTRRFWLELLERVRRGATLYLSHDDCLLSMFTGAFGVEVISRERLAGAVEAAMPGLPGKPALTLGGPIRLRLRARRAEVLGAEADGNPVFTRARHGRGRICFLTHPIEKLLAGAPGSFYGPQAQPFWQIYREVAGRELSRRVVARGDPLVGATEHPLSAKELLAVLINYSPEPRDARLTLARGWSVAEVLHGGPVRGGVCRLAPAGAAVLRLRRG